MNVLFSRPSGVKAQKDGRKVRSRWTSTFTFPREALDVPLAPTAPDHESPGGAPIRLRGSERPGPATASPPASLAIVPARSQLLRARFGEYRDPLAGNQEYGPAPEHAPSACSGAERRSRAGAGPISTRNRTDLVPELDRSRRGTGPISSRERPRAGTGSSEADPQFEHISRTRDMYTYVHGRPTKSRRSPLLQEQGYS